MHIVYYGTDTPIKGSQLQKIHADIPFLFPQNPDHQHPPVTLSVRFTFGEMTLENGPFEVAPGTQHLPREETIAKLECGEIPMESLLLDVGNVIISDARTPHRGTPIFCDRIQSQLFFRRINGQSKTRSKRGNTTFNGIFLPFFVTRGTKIVTQAQKTARVVVPTDRQLTKATFARYR